ncbi:MAG: hypothetical protein KDD42_00970 [Bdellovibrionales bacterium]|nr:hypothetical protein [Bdellovibrionales bacterium]
MAFNTIGEFKNIHAGKRLFILASGPSLADLDLSRLSNKIVMGLNRSILIYNDTHYHCCMDQRLFDLYPAELKRTRYLFTLEGRPWGIPLRLLGAEGFSHDLEQGVYTGYTVSFFAIQLALFMGFSEIVFIGLDLAHREGQTHFFGKDFHSRNHEDTEFPKMKKMLIYAANQVASQNLRIYDCSPLSTLTCFTKLSYENALLL